MDQKFHCKGTDQAHSAGDTISRANADSAAFSDVDAAGVQLILSFRTCVRTTPDTVGIDI